jgi:hypothetical protein
MGYKHDIFLSYTHAYPFADWVHEHFLPFFRSYLGNALGRPVDVFVDKSGILTGDAWEQRLKNALVFSRCLVCIWSPNYFDSEWCVKECHVMLHRENQLGYRTLQKPSGLILPVNAFDGESFPQFAKDIQYFDCRNFMRIGVGFTQIPRYVEFQDRMLEWVDEVALAVQNAPTWRAVWLTKSWVDDVINRTERPSRRVVRPPFLV